MAGTETRPRGVVDAQAALGFLAQASGVLAGSLDYEQTLQEVARLAVPDIADWCAVDVVQPDGSLRQITSGHPNPEHEALLLELRRRYREEKRGTEGVQRVIETGEPELATDVSGASALDLQDREGELYRELAPRSYMIVPLVARGRRLGALTFLSTREGSHYSESDLDFAQHLARRFALAVDNSRLYDEAERSWSMLDALFGSAPVGLAFYDTELRCVRVNEAQAELSRRPVDEYLGRRIEDVEAVSPEVVGLFRQVLESGEAVTGYELTSDDPGRKRHWLISCAPVRQAGGAPIGVTTAVVDVTERRELLERERTARRRWAFLASAGEILASSLDYETTLRNVAHIAVPEIADWCSVHVVDESGAIRLVAIAHADPDKERLGWELDKRFPPDSDSPRGTPNVIRTGQTEVVNDITDELLDAAVPDPELRQIVVDLGLRASVIAPLVARGRTLGALSFVAAESGRPFSEEDVEVVEELARRAGLAVDNARLYTERTRIAHTLQAELLPSRLPQIPGIELAVRYRAAGELNEVGGDFYDVFECGDGQWAFLIGDVSGKGAEAAAVTALARHTLQTASIEPRSARELLCTLNEALLTQRGGTEFCTVCLGRLRLDEGRSVFNVSLGGHPPALVLREGGGAERHGTSGTLLGVFQDPRLEEDEVELRAGDTVLLYTDGVTEAGSPGDDIGEEGLARLLERLAGHSPEEIVDAVVAAAVEAQEGRPRDDIALVAFRLAA
jgi:PAS domain S-box-containing protein